MQSNNNRYHFSLSLDRNVPLEREIAQLFEQAPRGWIRLWILKQVVSALGTTTPAMLESLQHAIIGATGATSTASPVIETRNIAVQSPPKPAVQQKPPNYSNLLVRPDKFDALSGLEVTGDD